MEREWENNGRQGALPGLNELSRKEIDWDRLEELARQDKVTLFGGIRAEKWNNSSKLNIGFKLLSAKYVFLF